MAIRPTFRNEAMFGARPDWSPAPTGDFPIEWPNPGDADLAWERDEMHLPSAVAPLAIDASIVTNGAGLTGGFAYFDIPIEMRVLGVNGYVYVAPIYGVPDEQVPALLASARVRFREFAAATPTYWSAALRELRAIYDQMQNADVDGLTAADLGEAWLQAWRGFARAWVIHFVIIRGAYRISEDLADLYAAAVPDSPKGTGYRLLQGRVDILHEVALGLERLAAAAAGSPAIAELLRQDRVPSLDELSAVRAGPAFVGLVEAFLEAHGHLGQTFSDFGEPSWDADPRGLLAELAKRLVHPPEPADERRRRLRAEADELVGETRRQLKGRPTELAEFERVLALAREVGPLTELHNYWIDRMSHARLRSLVIRVGRRLAREHTIAEPEDVLYLHRDEITALIAAPRPMGEIVAERRAEHARQMTVTPPRAIGRVDDEPKPPPEATSQVDTPAAIEGLRGVGASAGVVRGPARVTLSPTDVGRIGPGDIIVCPATNPSWVPVFAIAAGLVTNTGGILAHAAVVAREFGLPAVVGVAGATSRIPDGALIEIDGTAGSVRFIEG
jgi:phosphohistidine swiveling domain-containing protein